MKKTQVVLLMIFVVALSLRVGFMLFYDDGRMLLNRLYTADEYSYDEVVLNFLNGKGLVTAGGLYARIGPVYPLFLSAVYSSFGRSFVAVRFVQIVVSALTCVIVYLIGRELYDKKTGLASACVSAVYYPFIQQPVYLLTEVVFSFLLALSILLFVRYYNTRKDLPLFGASALLGIAALCRGYIIVYAIVLALWMGTIFGWKARETMRSISILFFGIAIILAPWTVRNYRIYHAFIPLTVDGGRLLYVGNNPAATGGTAGRTAHFIDQFYPNDVGDLGSLEADRIMLGRALSFMKSNPRKTILLMGRRFVNMWRPYYSDARRINKIIMSVSYVPLAMLSALGAVMAFFLDWKKALLLCGLIFTEIFVHLISIAEIRYRYPVEPYLILFAMFFLLNFRKKMA